MKKRLLSLFVFVLLLTFCVGCMPHDTQLYSVYMLPDGSGPDIFRDDVPTVNNLANKSTDTERNDPNLTAEVLFRGTLRELKLKQQMKDQWTEYKSDDGILSCRFDYTNGMLRMISAEGWLDPSVAQGMSDDDYLKWIKDLVNCYYSEDWSEYTLACTTQIRGSIANSQKMRTENAFVTFLEPYETVSAYTFTFTKYLGEYATSDRIQAYIRPDTGFVEVEFSAHEFDGAKPVEIDQELILASVFQFLSDSIAETRYGYNRHSTIQPKLAYVRGHLCYVCTIKVEVLSLDKNQEFENDDVLQPIAIVLY